MNMHKKELIIQTLKEIKIKMKKGLLQEIKAMNNIAGTQLTKEQEVALIRERLEQLNEGEIKMIGGGNIKYIRGRK